MRTAVVICLILITVVELADGARGGSRGGYRSGYRSSSGSSGSSGSSSTSKVRYYSGPVYKPSMWKAGTSEGVLFGVVSYKRRSLYTKYPDREPRVCFNEDNLREETYGYFICPEAYMDDNKDYCCGDQDEQRCCTHAEYEDEENRQKYITWGIVGGSVVVFLAIIACAVAVVYYDKRRKVKKRQTRQAQAAQEIAKHKSELEPPAQGGPTTPPEPEEQCPPLAEGEPDDNPDPGLPMPQAEQPDPIGFKDSKDGLPPATEPYPPGPPASGPGGFVQPAPGHGGGPMDPTAPPPAYSDI